MDRFQGEVHQLEHAWARQARWQGIRRNYTAAEVVRLRGSQRIKHSLARAGAGRLWELLTRQDRVATFGALSGAQATQMVKGGLDAIYVSGWQVAADANAAAHTYPDQSLYPSNSVPALVRRINNAFARADQIDWAENGHSTRHWFAPIVADAEAGFGGAIHAFELMKAMIEAGAAGVHFEDQLASEKKCGHLGGKVLVPTNQFIRTLSAARLAADVLDVPTVLVARTDSLGAKLVTSDIDPWDAEFLTGDRTPEGYFIVRCGIEAAIHRALAYAPYVDVLWYETSVPDIAEARAFAQAIAARFPGKLLAYNLSPSFNWRLKLADDAISRFQDDLAELGYHFQFITLAGWHLLNYHTFDLAQAFGAEGLPAYVRLQQAELDREIEGYTASRHQREAGTGYFDLVSATAAGGCSSTSALDGSTENDQFVEPAPCVQGDLYTIEQLENGEANVRLW